MLLAKIKNQTLFSSVCSGIRREMLASVSLREIQHFQKHVDIDICFLFISNSSGHNSPFNDNLVLDSE